MNLRGISFASLVQNVFTITKIGAIVILIIIGVYVGVSNEWVHFDHFFKETQTYNATTNTFENISIWQFGSLFGVAMIGPLFSSSAWNNVTFASADFEDPKKTIAKGLVYGAALVCLLYILTNIAYLGILPLEGDPNGASPYERGIMFASKDRLGSAALQAVLGTIGATVMAL